jgi:type VI secretion system secreted protein VgrG
MALLELSFESGETSLSVRNFRIEERVSQPFVVSVVALSPHQLDLETLIGKGAALRLLSGVAFHEHPERVYTGVCQHIELVRAEPTGLSTYELSLRPLFWLLGQRRGHRVHQHLSIPDIVDRVLAEWSIEATWSVERSGHPKLEHKVQYGESDLAFVTRLLEEAGLAYTFQSERGVTRLVISEALHTGEPRSPDLHFADNPNEASEKEMVTELHLAQEVRPGAYAISDYDFRRPAFTLSGEADRRAPPEDRYERYHYQPGAFLIEGAQGGDTPVADDKGVARHDERFGKGRASRALEGERAGRRSVSFRTNVLDISPGVVFRIENHPHQALSGDRRLLSIEQILEGSVAGEWTIRTRAVFADEPYRPKLVTPRPVAEGVQSATVVGPADQEIHTDEFGRVRVQFPWDREGKKNDDSSCWIRVAQGWAGTGFGLINLPRVGQEVLVGFLEGNPDCPMIVGRVFNATNPVPYPLPQHKTRSTWQSRSSPGGEGFNELMFEDLAGRELVWVQAEKDLRKLVKNDETITIGHDHQKLVKNDEIETVGVNRTEVTHQDRTEITKRDRTTVIRGNRRELVKGDSIERLEGESLLYVGSDQHLVTMGIKRERVDEDSHLLVKGDRKEQVGGDYGLSAGSHQIACGSQAVGAGGSIHLKAGSSIVVEAPDVTIKAPGGFVRVDGGGVTIVGSLVKINSGGGPGSGSGGGGASPEKPKEAEVEMPVIPEPDDVSQTKLGPGR